MGDEQRQLAETLKKTVGRQKKIIYSSDVVLEDRPWPRGSARTKKHVLGLGLESSGLGLGLGLEGPGPWP